MYWEGWTLARIVICFVSLAFLLIGIQVTLFHYRQNFHRKIMWLPVIASPIYFIFGMAYTFYNTDWLHYLFLAFMWKGALLGLVGFYFHFRGVGVRVGGYALRNFLIGPPVVLPLVFSAVSVLGIIGWFYT